MQQNHDEEARNIQETLIAQWEVRQAKLADLLEQSGATNGERDVDWVVGRVEWLNKEGTLVAKSEMKALCSYSFVDESLMMAWANVEIGEAAVIAPVPNMPDYIESCNIAEAWLYAMHLAQESDAEYLYRIASPRYLVFLGLWNVEPIQVAAPAPPDSDSDSDSDFDSDNKKSNAKIQQASKIPIPPGSPHWFVARLLDQMRVALEDGRNDSRFLRQHFVNHGESLWQNSQYLENDGADSDLLRQTSNGLIRIGRSFGQRRFGILPPAALSDEQVTNIVSQLADLHASWALASREYWQSK